MDHFFDQLPLQGFLLEALNTLDIRKPTPVQQQIIPAILRGADVIGQSQTGTGKTLAYLLPVLQQLDPRKHELQALILAPTRELTRQIAETAEQLAKGTDIDVLLIQGGVDINRQIQRLRRNPQVIVGTPGRVLELINQNKLAAYTSGFLVIDEADTMLEMGFKEDIEKILKKVKRNIQIMMFSATMPSQVGAMARKFMKQPLHVVINPGERAVMSIEHVYFRVREGAKEEALIRLVQLYNPYLGIVFTRKREQVDDLVTRLRQAGVNAEGLHGDMQPGQRKQVLKRFRETKSQIMVATDIAARGLDVEGITHIFNFEPPATVDQYIHRTGRTGRAGSSGVAVNLVYAAEEERVLRFGEKLGQAFKEKAIIKDEIVDKAGQSRTGGIKDADRKPLKTREKKFTGPNARKKAQKEAAKWAERNSKETSPRRGRQTSERGAKGSKR